MRLYNPFGVVLFKPAYKDKGTNKKKNGKKQMLNLKKIVLKWSILVKKNSLLDFVFENNF